MGHPLVGGWRDKEGGEEGACDNLCLRCVVKAYVGGEEGGGGGGEVWVCNATCGGHVNEGSPHVFVCSVCDCCILLYTVRHYHTPSHIIIHPQNTTPTKHNTHRTKTRGVHQ